MKFIAYTKKYKIEIIFVLLILFFGYMYFIVYLTPSRTAWYNYMFNQIQIIKDEIMKKVSSK